jgi:hypothetical protein
MLVTFTVGIKSSGWSIDPNGHVIAARLGLGPIFATSSPDPQHPRPTQVEADKSPGAAKQVVGLLIKG